MLKTIIIIIKYRVVAFISLPGSVFFNPSTAPSPFNDLVQSLYQELQDVSSTLFHSTPPSSHPLSTHLSFTDNRLRYSQLYDNIRVSPGNCQSHPDLTMFDSIITYKPSGDQVIFTPSTKSVVIVPKRY